jgi:hypothetical protein
MTQLSLLPALEAARFATPHSGSIQGGASAKTLSPMAPTNRPTPAQVAYLKKLTRIKSDAQLTRFVMRQLGFETTADAKGALTRQHFAKVIDMEVGHKRWAA